MSGTIFVNLFLLVLGWIVSYNPVNARIFQLDDKSFEHDTQASTGQTTGRWLVLFTTPECESCDRIEKLMQELNLSPFSNTVFAKVDVSKSKIVAERFRVSSVPHLLYLRDGKMFTPTVKLDTITAMDSYLQEGFQQSLAEDVPKEPNFIESIDLTQLVSLPLKFLEERPTLVACVGGMVALIFFALTRRLLGLDKKIIHGSKPTRSKRAD